MNEMSDRILRHVFRFGKHARPTTRPCLSHQASRVQFTTARKQPEHVIDLSKDTQRQEIGLEQETVLDSGWRPVSLQLRNLPAFYSKLSKRNLTALVVSTTVMGCVMAPLPFDPYTLAMVTLGTTLTSTAANTINQV